MVELRWIQMSLFLMLLLQFTESNGQRSLFIRSGHDVTLPCEIVINDQNKCDGTTWIFSGSGSRGAVELINLGQIDEDVGVKSDRLSVTENCSLVIMKVTDEDVGLYDCQQFNKSGQKPVSRSVVLLSVVSLTEQTNNDEVTSNCSVSTYERCTRSRKVKWLFKGRDVDKENKDLRTSGSPCSASVHFKTSHYIYTSRFNSLKCEVTDGDKVQLFSFITGPSGDGSNTTTTKQPPSPPTATTNSTNTYIDPLTKLKDLWWLFIIVALVLVALLIIVVKVVRRQRTKGKKTQMNDDIGLTSNPAETQSAAETSQDTADPEDGVSYASISYTKKSHSKGRVQNKTVDDEAVMYSTVKAPSIDPSSLYATIK